MKFPLYISYSLTSEEFLISITTLFSLNISYLWVSQSEENYFFIEYFMWFLHYFLPTLPSFLKTSRIYAVENLILQNFDAFLIFSFFNK